MARAARWIGWTLSAGLGLVLLLLALALVAANTPSGRAFIESRVEGLTGGEVRVSGLAGRFPDALRAGRIELHDGTGLWLAIDELRLDWKPSRLLVGSAGIDRLEAARIAMNRLPASTPAEPGEGSGFSLPVRVDLGSLRVARIDLGAPVAGIAAALAIEGRGHLGAPDRGEVELSAHRLDGAGDYTVQGRMDAAGLSARLHAGEPAGGLLSGLAGLPELGALSLAAEVEGPLSGLEITLGLKAGSLEANAHGTLDLDRRAADLRVTAKAAPMKPRPDVSWQSVALDARVRGPFDRPTAEASLMIDGLSAMETAVARLGAEIRSDAGKLKFRAELDGIRIPGPAPDLLRKAPLRLESAIRLDEKKRSVAFTLSHPLIAAQGEGTTAENPGGRIDVQLPDLAPFAAVAGLDLRGSTRLELGAATQGETLKLDLKGGLAVTGGTAPVPGLVGEQAKLDLALAVRGEEMSLTRLRFDGKTLALAADGRLPGKTADLGFKLALSDLKALAPRLSGRLAAEGRLRGPAANLAVTADLKGELGVEHRPSGPVAAAVQLTGLPGAPSGTVTAKGVLDRAPLELAVTLQSEKDGGFRLAVDRADWKSAHAEGALRLPKGTALPLGRLDLRLARLEDFAALLGQPLTGRVTAGLETTERTARLRLDAYDAGLAGTATVGRAELALAVSDPLAHPVVDGRLNLDGIAAGATRGSARLDAAGPDHALELRVFADLQALAGGDARLNGAATLDVPAAKAAVSSLEAAWKGETLKLLEPVRIVYRDGLTLDRLRLGLGKGGELEAAGRAAPNLDLSVAARNIPADLARLFTPGLALEGTLRADAQLNGPPQRPRGKLMAAARDLRLRSGPGRALPPAQLAVSADLAGEAARLDARLNAGSTALNLAGNVPFEASAPLDLRAGGRMDLALLDPLLAAQGRRLRGLVSLNGGVTGSLAEPRATGTVDLAQGEIQDYTQGLHLSRITARLRAEGDSLRLVQLEGHAGPGTIRAEGTVGILSKDLPIELRLAARNARPLSSDRLTVSLNADLNLQGQAAHRMEAGGKIHINRAEIMIPEHLPAGIAVLDVRRPGDKPPPPPAPGPEIALNLEIEAPGAIFVRGRGVDAELAGRIRVQGSAADPEPLGHFELRRGEFSLAGTTLTFSKGEVGFDGGSLTNPSLDFVAETTGNNVTATLGVAGTANKPKITLSSVPSLPQDEVLAQLLFNRGTANLSPFEWVQIAAAVASLTGIAPTGGNPLETVRKGLGLDRLSIGTGGSGSPSLEAGRYVAPGVYLGAKQGVTGTGTQATVQVDVIRGLKLEGSVGTGSSTTAASGSTTGTSTVGVTYQFEY